MAATIRQAQKGISQIFTNFAKAVAPTSQSPLFGAQSTSTSRLDSDVAVEREAWQAALPDLFAQSGRTQLVFLGCPGVGKGTYASRVAKVLEVPHISMGDLVRSEIKAQSTIGKQVAAMMGRGQLLADDIIFEMLSKRLAFGASAGENGFILDGFPRTTSQAETLEQVAGVDLVINLRLRKDILIAKCLGRRICSECGGNFNVADINVRSEAGLPDIVMPPLPPPRGCEAKMTQRADDVEVVVRSRLQVYEDETKPVEEFYRQRNLILDFDVLGGIPETWPRLLAALQVEEPMAEELPRAA
eukprot:jgi/Mesen1/2122/ME000152S01208